MREILSLQTLDWHNHFLVTKMLILQIVSLHYGTGTTKYGPALDMWSVGCIFAELLQRKLLFPGKDEKLCPLRRYHEAILIVTAYEKMGRPISSFIGNVLLHHSLISPQLYYTCDYLRGVEEWGFCGNSALSLVIGAFSGCLGVSHYISDLERLIEKCLPPDIFTYNLLLKELSKNDMDKARLLFARTCQKGYEPDGWTYDIMVRGFSNHGRKDEAKRWLEEMLRKGYYVL